MALWIYRLTQGNSKSGRSENEWDENSHHFWFTNVCSITWVSQATNSRLRLKLWTFNGSSTRETYAFHQVPQESRKYPFIDICREMGKGVKVVILHVEIILYHWSDPVYDEGIRETNERVCSWGRFLYLPWCFSVDDIKGDVQMDEREQLLPLLIASHEWIAGQDTLCWAPCR